MILEKLEPYEGKLSRTVPRGAWIRKDLSLPGDAMKWLADDIDLGQATLTAIVLVIAIGAVWLGRRRLRVVVPAAGLFLLLAAVAIPSAIPARTAALRNACVFNLRSIQDAKIQWSREHGMGPGDIPTEIEIYGTNGSGGVLRHRLDCPRGGAYLIGALGQNPMCTFSNGGHRLP